MKTIRSLGVLIVAGWLTASIAYGQQPTYEPVFPAPSPFAPLPDQAPPTVSAHTGLSDWIRYPRECCEGAPTKRTPFYMEVYFSGGASFPLARNTSDLARELQTGWTLMGGARGLLFNEDMSAAWVLDLHIINIHQFAGGNNNAAFPLTVFPGGVRIQSGENNEPNFNLEDMNRTLVGLGFGREWYLWNPANFDGLNGRFGMDGGGRVGSERLNVVNAARSAHTVGVIESVYAAAHCDLELPCGAVLFNAGFRLEWAYTFSGILQTGNDKSNMQDLSLLFTIGVRY
jgi:hypothetical protein